MRPALARLAIAALALGLSGCAALVAGGAVTAMATAHDRRSTSEVWKDNRLELSIMDAINRDKELALRNHVAVVSHNRIVLVIGEVRTPELKERALGIVRSFKDVRRVVDELQVREPAPFGTGARDAAITARAKTALLDIVDLPGFDVTRVNVTTRDGVVYLMGLVTREEAERVAGTVSRLSGVVRVVKVFEYIEPAG
jgi:osmotically-inducible protein OsmY